VNETRWNAGRGDIRSVNPNFSLIGNEAGIIIVLPHSLTCGLQAYPVHYRMIAFIVGYNNRFNLAGRYDGELISKIIERKKREAFHVRRVTNKR
jgi:hypothetical protein